MSEQADTPDNSGRTVVYFYHRKRVHASDGDSKLNATKFVNSDFFGSFFNSRNKELQQMEKKIDLMEEAIRERKMQQLHEELRFLKQSRAGKLDFECTKRWVALDMVETYLIEKEEDKLHKLEEDYVDFKDTLLSPLLQLPPAPCTGSQ